MSILILTLYWPQWKKLLFHLHFIRKICVCLTSNQLKMIPFNFYSENKPTGLCLPKSSNMSCAPVVKWLMNDNFNMCSVCHAGRGLLFCEWRDIRWRHRSKMAAGGSGEEAFNTFYTEVRLKQPYTLYTHIHEQNVLTHPDVRRRVPHSVCVLNTELPI